MMTTWYGATRGGKIRPLSSPWVITSAPISRVVMPQDVPQMYWSDLSLRLELDAEGLGEVLPEVVGRGSLQRAAVAHERLDRVGLGRARELLAVALDARR